MPRSAQQRIVDTTVITADNTTRDIDTSRCETRSGARVWETVIWEQ
jgi:hypothetical protein